MLKMETRRNFLKKTGLFGLASVSPKSISSDKKMERKLKVKDASQMPSDSEGNMGETDSMWGYLWPGKFDDYRLITLEDKAYLCEFDADRHRITKFKDGKVLGQYGGLHMGEVREDWFYLWIEAYEEDF